MKFDRETRMTISILARNGQSGRAIARMLGVTEHAVRYHLQRQQAGAVDCQQACKAPHLSALKVPHPTSTEVGDGERCRC
jgi:predicted ArsR family transcriptional regulator